MAESPLTNLGAQLDIIFKGALESKSEWGKANAAHTHDFNASLAAFSSAILQMSHGGHGAVSLAIPSSFDSQEGVPDLPAVTLALKIVRGWCPVVTRLIASNEPPAEEGSDLKKTFEWWHQRVVDLAHVVQQIRSPVVQRIVNSLATHARASTAGDLVEEVPAVVRLWKDCDLGMTEQFNIAKDTLRYLRTLEQFTQCLYLQRPAAVVDGMPALLNAARTLHTASRFFQNLGNTQKLLHAIFNRAVGVCKEYCMDLEADETEEKMFKKTPALLVQRLTECLTSLESAEEIFSATCEDYAATGDDAWLTIDRAELFRDMRMCARRCTKLHAMFGTMADFDQLTLQGLEGMEDVTARYRRVCFEMQSKRHNLFAFRDQAFDRDFVEFNVRIDELEAMMLHFTKGSFNGIRNVKAALELHTKFAGVFLRPILQADLRERLAVIFTTFGAELERVQTLYEDNKHAPPRPRNMPPVAGNIMWCRHLFSRIQEPMDFFARHSEILSSKLGKKIVRLYNRVARTLVAFEFLWYQAWVESIEKAKTGLAATLIVRHPSDRQLYVNFDKEILQLIRESKCMKRMGISVPESAHSVLLQEQKYKVYYHSVHDMLQRYHSIKSQVIHACHALFQPALDDIEYKMRPGLVSLTWTTMNIDAFKAHVQSGLDRLHALTNNAGDIVANRIELNVKRVAKTELVELPSSSTLSLEDFLSEQSAFITKRQASIIDSDTTVRRAVDDLVALIGEYEVDSSVEPCHPSEYSILRQHYGSFMYAGMLGCVKRSLNTLKERLLHRSESTFLVLKPPFFEVQVHLQVPSVQLNPSVQQVQDVINSVCRLVLNAFKSVSAWGKEVSTKSVYELLTSDMAVVRVILLLAGSFQGARNQTSSYLTSFDKFSWLWTKDADAEYQRFLEKSPTMDDYESELAQFARVEAAIASISLVYNIGALSLRTEGLKQQLLHENQTWKKRYSENLHRQGREMLVKITEYTKNTLAQLDRPVTGLNSLRYTMDVLKEIRSRETMIQRQINPIMDMYMLLEIHGVSLAQEEMDQKSIVWSSWKKVVERADEKTMSIAAVQGDHRRQLLIDLKSFAEKAQDFRRDYLERGPMVEGIDPLEAMNRLKRFEDKFEIMERKRQLYNGGEDLFALPITPFPELDETKKELTLLNKLYGLYKDVMNQMDEYKTILWADVKENVDQMIADMESFSSRCKKMPKRLRSWQAYLELKAKIEDFQLVLPLLTQLAQECVIARHWAALESICGCEGALDVDDPEFKLRDLMAQPLEAHFEEIEEVTIGAVKEADLEIKIRVLSEKWVSRQIQFQEYASRAGVMTMTAVPVIIEELEEDQMALQQYLTSRYVAPFKENTQRLLQDLSDTSETLELWLKVQLQWSSLEVVFLGGDIAKQMPAVAKKFQKMDKDFINIMSSASKTAVAVSCCQNEVLKSTLPTMYEQLENCQKHLDGYLEQKRNKFPRFFFCSGPVLLQILSKGSDPQAIQEYYQNVFDSIGRVEHDKKDKDLIVGMTSFLKGGVEQIELRKPVKCQGNIEDWLMALLVEHQRTMKWHCAECAAEIAAVGDNLENLRGFVDGQCGQYALLGIQLMWTADSELALANGKTQKGIVEQAKRKALDVQRTMGTWCLQDLGSKINRIKIETLVTIQVHQSDVSRDIASLWKQKKVRSSDDFEWLKQARFYWVPEEGDQLDEDGACRISVTDVNFLYQFEYLGVKERLVITPLTDRCYITLAQALGMYFGGAPAGPAGTGKTETVKDMGRTLGIYVIVTNCSDQMRYTDCAKIFKGLCQAGLWGCFDEFNRIALPVLSVVAQQVQAVNNAKKASAKYFTFPGDDTKTELNSVCGFFITMNPGYAGRQELPENLKALFRGVAMMVPDRQIIIKVKLVSVGYQNADLLSTKFFICYRLCEEQLSKQRHYDFGLRNILSVLRTAGNTKRQNLDVDEQILLYRTLRDMNLSKLVAQDVPLFLSMLEDLFPQYGAPEKAEFPELMDALTEVVAENSLRMHPEWVTKVVQLHETCLVRHGIMLSGPTGGGKTGIFNCLSQARQRWQGETYKLVRLNPKAILAHELYGSYDPLSGEWVKGVFSSIWEKYNKVDVPHNTWIIEDGPVDAIWIEDMNTVLDDNRILTLSNGDRFPMTDNVKIMFENETLRNASPATVSRCGIVYVSEEDLDWKPKWDAWLMLQRADFREVFDELVAQIVGRCAPPEPGHLFDFLARQTERVMIIPRIGAITSMCTLIECIIGRAADKLPTGPSQLRVVLGKIMLFAASWAIAGVLEPSDREKYTAYIASHTGDFMPKCDGGETVFEFALNEHSWEWESWSPPQWYYPIKDEPLDFSNLLVPTMDSTRSIFLLHALNSMNRPTIMTGGSGTAKTSTALMFMSEFDNAHMLSKRLNFSSATSMRMFQDAIESSLDKRGGKNFGPPAGKKMTVFIDDISMPEINEWGDQPTNEIVRQVIESHGLYFLDKDKRGDFKVCEDLRWLGAMTHPGGGRNDIPNRLKRQFFAFNLVLPSLKSIDDLYGQMLNGRFKSDQFSAECVAVVRKLTTATIELWNTVKAKMLPTPAKFHYVFNMRELSRVFQGILLTPKASVQTGGQQIRSDDQAQNLLRLWKHECERVFSDKLVLNEEKAWYAKRAQQVLQDAYGADMASKCSEDTFWVDFFRDDIYDSDDVLVELAPKIYEAGGALDDVRQRVLHFMKKHNEEFPARGLQLVLFEDALRHLIRIARILAMPCGCALLVGVGGSGKQSLTRLAAYMARSTLFQVTLTKTYNVASFMEDLKFCQDIAGHQRKSVTFMLTDAEIKNEAFLEYVNSLLLTGEVPGLFAKDELMGITADLAPVFAKSRPDVEENQDNLRQYFFDLARDNLHIVLCFSPVNAKFSERARRFPGLFSGCTIDWFLPWPEEALVSVSKGFLGDYAMETPDSVKTALMTHMGMVHNMVVQVCEDYYGSMRRHVYQTPKSYLAFIANYKELYQIKLHALQKQESNVNTGLQKLVEGSKGVDEMKGVLKIEQQKVAVAAEKVNKLLATLAVKRKEAEAQGEKVAIIKAGCEEEASKIEAEKALCQADLDKAQPIVDRAINAAASITAKDIQAIKAVKPSPPAAIKYVLDIVVLLYQAPILPVTIGEGATNVVCGTELDFLVDSYKHSALQMLGQADFLARLQTYDKDGVNEETCELVEVYSLHPWLNADHLAAKKMSDYVVSMAVWAGAMRDYFYASRVVKPKLEALQVAQGKLDKALKALAGAEAEEKKVMDMLAALQAEYDEQMAAKQELEDNANKLASTLDQAEKLINGLAGEKIRWTEDSKAFAEQKKRLVGDCAVACAFICYCGPFNAPFRHKLITEKFTTDLKQRQVPVTEGLDIISFLVDQGTVGDWNLDGLPTDPLSVQNGILVTRSSRYPLLVDPQGQALTWIRNKEMSKLPKPPVTAINSSRLKDNLEFCMGQGFAFLVINVEEELDPLLDPVLEKQIIVRNKRKYIRIADGEVEMDEGFSMFFITRLPNPHFSPELQAKTTVVDFTVTMSGLEDQLLGRVIKKEKRELEEMLEQVLQEVNANRKALQELDAVLLERLSGGGNLLEDTELVGVLNNTKAKAAEVKEKLEAADETRQNISEQREAYRPVATRGSVLYFSIVDMSLVNVMYQTSLKQFIELFGKSIDEAEKSALASKRVENIVDHMTYVAYRYINRGLYERHKLLFVLVFTVKILVKANILDASEVQLFLQAGAAIDPTTAGNPPKWMPTEPWMNIKALSNSVPFYKSLGESIARNESAWRAWYDSNDPERVPIPDFEVPLSEDHEAGPWRRLLLIRALRKDRALLGIRQFIRNVRQVGERYVAPVSDTIESIYEGMNSTVPVVFLLSIGADPTEAIESLAKKKKTTVESISMGEGQEAIAKRMMDKAAVNGTWVLLQNCELGLDLMVEMEDLLTKMRDAVADDFRLFITALPSSDFPLGLLQMSTKVTNEPPSGLKAGLYRSYTVEVDQDRLERIDTPSQAPMWRKLVYNLCFLHSVVQERRKFGPLGWCVPYEYNSGDLRACIMFLEKHLYSGPISWPTFQYMVAEAQYGGKITDDFDRRLFNAYASRWITPSTLEESFRYNPAHPINQIPDNFQYEVLSAVEIEPYRQLASTFPDIDSPEIFGLHPNGDLTFRVKEVNELISTMENTQPKQSSAVGGRSQDDIVTEKANELLEKLPDAYNEDDYKAKIRKLGGLSKPRNIFLFQEIQRLAAVIDRTRNMLEQMKLAIKGEVVLTTELQNAMADIFGAKVPKSWLYTPGGDEFSWLLVNLGQWFASFLQRDEQIRTWLTSRPPPCYWLTGFFNPQGFLTAMKQEVTRAHKSEGWALDNVTYHAEVTDMKSAEQVREPPAEGVFIDGLFLDGARWGKSEGSLVESEPKVLFSPLPVLFMTTIKESQVALKSEIYSPTGNAPYMCPIYRYPDRTDRYLVVAIPVPTKLQKANHWVLRGVALLCITER